MKSITLRQALAIAAASAAMLSAPAFAQQDAQAVQAGEIAAVQERGLSRAEVLADLVLYRRAGLDAFGTGEAASLGNPGYARALSEYQRLRSGPEYLAEVRRLGGQADTVAGQRPETVVR